MDLLRKLSRVRVFVLSIVFVLVLMWVLVLVSISAAGHVGPRKIFKTF